MLEVQVALDSRPLIVRADDLILVADDVLYSLEPGFAELDEHGTLVIKGSNRTVTYRLLDHDDEHGTWVGVRAGGRADR